MGQAILECSLKDTEIKIEGAIEKKEHPSMGKPLTSPADIQELNIILKDSLRGFKDDCVLIEFSSPSATIQHLREAVNLKIPMVIGTTGLSKEQDDEISESSIKIPIVYAPNMSVGVNLLFKLTEIAAKVLQENYDIEIWETHHRYKKDAPSGTARKLAQIIAKELNISYDKDVRYGRVGITGDRPPREIGIHCLRAGDIVGEHTVLFATLGERIEFTHRAHSRATFALGALKAAKFISLASRKLYSMMDVLGLSD